jgi:hypothetical protein
VSDVAQGRCIVDRAAGKVDWDAKSLIAISTFNPKDDRICRRALALIECSAFRFLTPLFEDLSDFTRGSGMAIKKAIQNRAKPLPLDLQTYGGD